MIFLFVLVLILILILSCRRHLTTFQFFRLKKKIKNKPYIGIKQEDDSYSYGEWGHTVGYRVKESPLGLTVEWLHFKRRLLFIEKKILDIKRVLNKFFLYEGWSKLLRYSLIAVLLGMITLFYLGVKQQPAKQKEQSELSAVAQMGGMSPAALKRRMKSGLGFRGI
jgi:hypothetical protein